MTTRAVRVQKMCIKGASRSFLSIIFLSKVGKGGQKAISPLSSLLPCSLEFLPKSWRDHNFIVIVAVFPLPSSRLSSSLPSCGQKPPPSPIFCGQKLFPKSWGDHDFPLPSSRRLSSSLLPEARGQKLFPKPWCDHDLVIVCRIGLISLRHGSIDKVLILNYGLLAIIWVMNVFADDLCRLNGSCRTRGAVCDW